MEGIRFLEVSILQLEKQAATSRAQVAKLQSELDSSTYTSWGGSAITDHMRGHEAGILCGLEIGIDYLIRARNISRNELTSPQVSRTMNR